MNIVERIKEIHEFIVHDSIDHAIKRSLDYVNEFSKSKEDLYFIIVISSEYNDLVKNLRMGNIDLDYRDIKRRRLLLQLLELLDKVKNNFATQSQ